MEKIVTAQQALKSLESILEEPYSLIVRDATIQRFEYTAEAVWKGVSSWLKVEELLEERHPRGCYRALFRIGRIDEDLSLALLRAVEDRNRTSHAYLEPIAVAVFDNIRDHAKAFRAVLECLQD